MNKQQIIAKLNETDDFRAMGFEIVADDGKNALLRRKCGNGFMLINRFESDERENGETAVYSNDVTGWNNER